MAPTTRSGKPSDRGIAIGICVALAAAVWVIYAQTGDFTFLSLDDANFLLYRREVSGGLSWDNFVWAFKTVQPNWHPFTWLTHQLDFSLYGTEAGPHHLISVAIHAANAALCFLAFRALTGALWPSALVAALFALHPLRVESVSWLAERKDLTAGFFWLATLLAYAAYARRTDWSRYALVSVALVLGLLSKTMVVSLPLVLLLLDYWPLRRIPSPLAGEGTGWGRTARTDPPTRTLPRKEGGILKVLIEKLPWIGLAIAASAVTVVTQTSVRGVKSLSMVPMEWRLVNAPIAYVMYLVKTVWPTNLAAMYPHPALIASSQLGDYVWPAAGATVLLLALTAMALAAARRAPYVTVGWLWYLITLVPVIGLVQVGMQSYADRYLYLPALGLYLIVAWGLRDAVARWPGLRIPVAATSAAVLLALAVLSWRQAATWRNSTTVYEQMIAATDNNYFAHQSLGAQLLSEKRFDEARTHIETALKIRPTESYAHRQLALYYEMLGNVDAAAAEYELAVQYNPAASQGRLSLAGIRMQQQRWDDVVTLLLPVIDTLDRNIQANLNVATALQQLGRHTDAIPYLERTVVLAPNSAQAQNNLGVALAQLGRYEEAEKRFERALALNPSHPSARKSLEFVRQKRAQ